MPPKARESHPVTCDPSVSPGRRWLILFLRIAILLLLLSHSVFPWSLAETLPQRPVKDGTAERAEGIVRKSLVAYGGEAASLSIKDASFGYQVESMGESSSKLLEVKVYFKGSDFYRSDVISEKTETTTVLNHDKGWLKINDTVLFLSKKNLEPLKAEVVSQLRPDLLLLSFQKFRYFGRTEEDGHKLDQVDVAGFLGGEYTRGRLSFDLSTNLIYSYEFESERETESGKGIIYGQCKYVKYGEEGGLKVPLEVVSVQGKKASRIKVIRIDSKTVLDENLFAEPSYPISNTGKQ